MPRCEVCTRDAFLQVGRLKVTRLEVALVLAAASVGIPAFWELRGLLDGREPDPVGTVRRLVILVPVVFACMLWNMRCLLHVGHETRRLAVVWQLLTAVLAFAYAVQMPYTLSALERGKDETALRAALGGIAAESGAEVGSTDRWRKPATRSPLPGQPQRHR
jgi:hypothetical protein